MDNEEALLEWAVGHEKRIHIVEQTVKSVNQKINAVFILILFFFLLKYKCAK